MWYPGFLNLSLPQLGRHFTNILITGNAAIRRVMIGPLTIPGDLYDSLPLDLNSTVFCVPGQIISSTALLVPSFMALAFSFPVSGGGGGRGLFVDFSFFCFLAYVGLSHRRFKLLRTRHFVCCTT